MNYLEAIQNYRPLNKEEEAEKQIILDFIRQRGKEVLLRSSALAHMTATAMVFNEKRTKILMVHHNIYKTWACVGGHADGMNDLMEVAKKELEEETGLAFGVSISKDIFSLDILQVHSHYKNEVYVPNHLHLNVTYAFVAKEEMPLRIKEDENSGVAWIPIEELRNYSAEEDFIEVYEKIIKKIIK